MVSSVELTFHEDSKTIPLVWYASYGSNMDADRFACYIAGGTPIGGARNYIGCEDKSPPLADAAIELPYQLYFAGESKVWTGGLAFIGHHPGGEATRGRAYLITAHQFEQVVAQESRREDHLVVDIEMLRSTGRLTLGPGGYDEVIYCGEREGYPIISFTSPVERTPYAKPAPAYLKMIAAGLRTVHDLSVFETVSYLIDKPGIVGQYSKNDLLGIIG